MDSLGRKPNQTHEKSKGAGSPQVPPGEACQLGAGGARGGDQLATQLGSSTCSRR